MQNPIKRFEANVNGRDFVIGDLHGSYEVFLKLLEHLEFDPEVDRMFSVGDLVDRGEDSLNCLRLLKEPWFHCVLANHEQMMVDAFDGGYIGQFWFRNGGGWGLQLYKDFIDFKRDSHKPDGFQLPPEGIEFQELLQAVRELPMLITVDMQDGSKTHIIHAEFPPGHITDSDLSSPEKLMELATVQSRDGDFLTWGRHKFYNFYMTDLGNHSKNIRIVKNQYRDHEVNTKLSRIISGHTIVQRPLTILGQTNIDTQAYGGYPDSHGSMKSWCGLTCIELNKWSFTKTSMKGTVSTAPIVINTSDFNSFKEENENRQPT